MTTAQVCETSVSATLSTTTADPITFLGSGKYLCVTNHDASNKLYFRVSPTNEVQTITFTSYDATDTIKFTYGGVESAAVLYSADVSKDIQAALESLPGIGRGNVLVTKSTTAIYVVYFRGALAHKDVSAITCTSGTGGSSGAVVETLKGGSSVAVALGADVYVVLPGKDKTIGPGNFGPATQLSVVGSANVYTAEIW